MPPLQSIFFLSLKVYIYFFFFWVCPFCTSVCYVFFVSLPVPSFFNYFRLIFLLLVGAFFVVFLTFPVDHVFLFILISLLFIFYFFVFFLCHRQYLRSCFFLIIFFLCAACFFFLRIFYLFSLSLSYSFFLSFLRSFCFFIHISFVSSHNISPFITDQFFNLFSYFCSVRFTVILFLRKAKASW